MTTFATLVTLLFFSGSAISQIDAADCTEAGWEWVRDLNVSCPSDQPLNELCSRRTTLSFKLRVQSLPTCSRHVMGVVSVHTACTSTTVLFFAAFTIDPLPTGSQYQGPTTYDPCECNTVIYSLMSACDFCQGQTCISYDRQPCLCCLVYISAVRWSQFSANCTNVLPPSTSVSRFFKETFWGIWRFALTM